jgi:3-hydroxyisobutyrate dehydrogenase-like beta-hydroxyacid dehydrogenase
MAEKIGFIGVGIMGRPMVKNRQGLLPGHVYDVVPAALEALVNVARRRRLVESARGDERRRHRAA